MSDENASVSLSEDPRAKGPRQVDVSLRVVVEVSFVEVFRDDQTVGQVQREATGRAVRFFESVMEDYRRVNPDPIFSLRVVDRESAELKGKTEQCRKALGVPDNVVLDCPVCSHSAHSGRVCLQTIPNEEHPLDSDLSCGCEWSLTG